MTKLVAFDLDGTLNMTHTYAVAAYQEALKGAGGRACCRERDTLQVRCF